MIVKGGKVDKSTCRYGNFSHIASDDSTEKTKKKGTWGINFAFVN